MELNVFSQHEQALTFRALRTQVLTNNIANADTPNFKARDYDFSTMLDRAQGGSLELRATSSRHIGTGFKDLSEANAGELKYRIPHKPSLDGNTVETDIEQARFAENALYYRASLAFLDGQIRTLKFALRGGD